MTKMPVSRTEVFRMVDGLEAFAANLGLGGWEVEKLIGVHGGVWPIPSARRELWWPSDEQSARIASLCEVCAAVVWLMGSDARIWLRKRNAGLGCTPIGFLLREPGSLGVLRDVLRAEHGQC